MPAILYFIGFFIKLVNHEEVDLILTSISLNVSQNYITLMIEQ